MKIGDVDTPALLIDLDVMEHNIRRLQDYMDRHGLDNRPHVKTHKIPAIAHVQLAAGASGITCQKLGEAEVMAAAGIEDILVTYNVVGPQKLERLVRLAKRTHLSVTVDSPEVARGISGAAKAAGVVIDVLVELGSELERTGAPTPAALVELARAVEPLPGLRLRGLMIYPSHPENAVHIAAAVEGLRRAGLPTEVVSGGGTPGAWQAHRIPGLTEHRAGSYIFNDTVMIERGAATVDDCALTVLTMVVSRPAAERAIIDAGRKTFSSDGELPGGYVVEYPEAQLYRLSEEHGFVDVGACRNPPHVGECLRVVPIRAGGAVNMHDVAYGVRGDEVEVVWEIQARGKVR